MKNNAILLCGGIGRRMAPIPNCNKSLLHIKGVENLKRIILLLQSREITDIVVATNPIALADIQESVNNILSTNSDLRIKIVVAEDYVDGCNNVVTMRAAAPYIENTYIIETDQYYEGSQISFLESNPLGRSFLFTQKRGPEDWAVISEGDNSVKQILQENPSNGYCLAGITYFQGAEASYLKEALLSYEGQDIYWEELIDLSVMKLFSYNRVRAYASEYDNISDLVNKNLMKSQDIADLIDDSHNAERLGSMTNATYKVSVDGDLYALRIPGYGTDRFVNHHRERYMESLAPSSIRPISQYFSNDEVKLTEFLEGYHTFNDMRDISYVLETLKVLHTSEISPDYKEYVIDLMEEISDYESIYEGILSPYEGYDILKSAVHQFLDAWFETHTYQPVHRDLVPLNIMINSSKDVKLIDWEYAGYLSPYWDLASLCCEYADEYNISLEDVVDSVIANSTTVIDRTDLYYWIAVVDFVWSAWSLAKVVLGDDVRDYGVRRFQRALSLSNKC